MSSQTCLDELPPLLRDRAIRLADFGVGVADVAYPMDVAQEVIDELGSRDVPILGGDFWSKLAERRPAPTYEGWHIEQRSEETDAEFAQRAMARASSEVNRRAARPDLLLVLVCRPRRQS